MKRLYINYLKRLFDLMFAIIVIICLLPVLIIVSLLIRLKLGSPVLFSQKRPGLNERIFTLYKFRSMTNKVDKDGLLLPDKLRLTKFGRFLRNSSLDELPELINIIKGEMSFVGPRPLAEDYLPHYTEKERLRHSVRPGLTGLAQINGRNTINWEERFSYDIKYVEKMSFSLDLSILLKTFINVFKSKDIGERGVDAPIDFDTYRESMKKE